MKAQSENPADASPIVAPADLKPYQRVDPKTGLVGSIFKYLEGHPRQYRFDAKKGIFNINGVEEIGQTLSFQPIAWRLFTDDILKMGRKKWAEIFFIDSLNCVSVILFHGYSVDNIYRLIEPLYYADLSMADAVITATLVKKENTKIQPKGVYFLAEFTYKNAPTPTDDALRSFVADTKLFRLETVTKTAETTTTVNYHSPLVTGEDLPARGQPDDYKLETAEVYESGLVGAGADNDLPY